jgi:hypothetical protein
MMLQLVVATGLISHVGLCPIIPRRHLGSPDPARGLRSRMVFHGMAEEIDRSSNALEF